MAKKRFFWFALAAELVFIGVLARFGDLAQHGNSGRFVTIYLTAGAAYLLAVASFGTVPKKHRPRIFWLFALALRLAIFPMPAGDDLWRYIWEGKVQLHGANPYLQSPGAESLAPMRDEIWPKINHREWPAIYPPATELLFAQMARISPSPWFFKAVFAAADLLVCFLLLRLNAGPGRYRATAWFAWNPLVICAFAGAGHFDSVLLLAMTAAIWALHRATPPGVLRVGWLWPLASAATLGLAIAIKSVPVFLLPAWIVALRWRSLALVLSVAIPWLLAMLFGGFAVVQKPLTDFANVSRFNDAMWWFFEMHWWPSIVKQTVNAGWFQVLPFLGLNPYFENSCFIVFLGLAVATITFIFHRDWRRASLWTLGAALILSPVLHPWYVTWILPLACWRKQFAWFVFALSVAVCLLVWEAGPFWGEWQMTAPLHLLVVTPPLLAWVYLRRKNEFADA